MNKNGFTIIELMVVIVIIGIISAISIPYFGGFANRSKLDNACQDWLSYASYARTEAVTNGVNYHLTCDLDQQTYWLTYETSSTGITGQNLSPSSDWGQVVTLDSTIHLASIQLDQNPSQESGQVSILFSPKGTANDAILLFRNYDQEEKQIVLTGITGIAKIQSSDTTT